MLFRKTGYLQKFPAVDISLIDSFDFAVLSDPKTMRTMTDKLLSDYDIHIKEKVEVSSNEALLNIVHSGVCALIIQSGLVWEANDSAAFFSVRQETAARSIAVIHIKDRYMSKPISNPIEIFKSLS